MGPEDIHQPAQRITLKDQLRRLWRMNHTPEDIGLGVGIGAFISILPVYGLHTILALGAAFAIKRVNKIAVLLGTCVSSVVTFPFITFTAYDIGRFVLRDGYPPLTWRAFRAFSYKMVFDIYYPLFVGSVILGIVVGVVFFCLTVWFVKWRRRGTVIALIFAVLLCGNAWAKDYTGEKITYSISIGGNAEYTDRGLVDLDNRAVRSVTFKTHIGGVLDDFETIFAEPDTFLPLRIERDVHYLFKKEHIIEEYSPQTSSAVVRKYIRDKFIKEYRLSQDKPIRNAILLPFYLRTVPDLQIGWTMDIHIARSYTVTLAGIEEVEVPAGKFTAYRFISEPKKFEVWITQDDDRIPIKISGTGGYKYTLEMKARSIGP